VKPTQEEVFGYFESLSNWGRWGENDELGTLNLITAATRVAAARLVQTGETVTMAHILDPKNGDRLNRGSVLQRYMVWTGEGEVPPESHGLPEHGKGQLRLQAAREYVGYIAHGSPTHLDALSHAMWEGKMYNGFPASAVTAPNGATRLSVHEVETGIFTRGVLLDIAATHGVDYLEAGYGVTVEDLDEAEKRQNVTVGEGDALMIYTGHNERIAVEGLTPDQAGSGYAPECLPWLRQRDVALISSDSVNDVFPPIYEDPNLHAPIHSVALVAMGLWMVDQMSLRGLAKACEERQRWEFFFTLLPLRIVGSTSSLVNPVAIF
jgi:kynurenine formamidase